MKIDVEVLNKKLTNHIQQHVKRILDHDQVGFSPAVQDWLSIRKSINVINYQSNKNKNHINISIVAEKAFDQTPLHNTSMHQSRTRRGLLTGRRAFMKNLQVPSYL